MIVCEKPSKKGRLSQKDIMAIEAVLAKDQRVELIPTKDGVRVIHIRRDEVKGDTAVRR